MCFFFEYAVCGHKVHYPSTDKCPPESLVEKIQDEYTGGCPIQMDRDAVVLKKLPESFLLPDPGFGPHDCPACPLDYIHKKKGSQSHEFPFERATATLEHQALEEFDIQKETNFKLLHSLGGMALTEPRSIQFPWPNWVQGGVALNRFAAPLPDNYEQRLAHSESIKVPGPKSAHLLDPMIPKPEKVSHTRDPTSPSRRYTHPQYDDQWKPAPDVIERSFELRGSLPKFLEDHIPGAQHYDVRQTKNIFDEKLARYDTTNWPGQIRPIQPTGNIRRVSKVQSSPLASAGPSGTELGPHASYVAGPSFRATQPLVPVHGAHLLGSPMLVPQVGFFSHQRSFPGPPLSAFPSMMFNSQFSPTNPLAYIPSIYQPQQQITFPVFFGQLPFWAAFNMMSTPVQQPSGGLPAYTPTGPRAANMLPRGPHTRGRGGHTRGKRSRNRRNKRENEGAGAGARVSAG